MARVEEAVAGWRLQLEDAEAARSKLDKVGPPSGTRGRRRRARGTRSRGAGRGAGEGRAQSGRGPGARERCAVLCCALRCCPRGFSPSCNVRPPTCDQAHLKSAAEAKLAKAALDRELKALRDQQVRPCGPYVS